MSVYISSPKQDEKLVLTKTLFFVFINMSWHEVCQFLDQSDPNGGLGTHKREKMLLDDVLLEGSSYVNYLEISPHTVSAGPEDRNVCSIT